ncbi:pentapeptide repeat-containing protein [Lentzea sp. NPDC051213]|uniref:pentapeptide repeat-containing protein n=1 Tax=Lentzea sp. NPDC051213 TaxID=3364126 RepID=UPI00379D3389
MSIGAWTIVMRRVHWPLTLGLTCLLLLILASLVLIPQLLYPRLTDGELLAVSSPETRIQLQQAQSQLQNGARSALLQAIAGLLVVAGAIATWRQVQVNREGQITERFTRAVDQIGSENIDVRIGGIYALERVAKNSTPDRPQVQYILAAFIRGHAPWPHPAVNDGESSAGTTPDSLPWLYVRCPDVQAALNVLGRRQISPGTLRLYLSRVDLRSANLDNARLIGAQIRHANLARSWMVAAVFNKSDLCYTNLRQVRATKASFANAILRGATLEGADLHEADLRGVDLRGADMRARNLEYADLTGAIANDRTLWPEGFDASNVVMASEATTEDAPPPSVAEPR